MSFICWWLYTVQTNWNSHWLNYLTNDLLTLEKWEKKWKMKLNIDKCMVLTVTLKNNPKRHNILYITMARLASVTSAKYLGITIDSRLSFNEHVVITCKKANSILAFICRNFRSYQRKIKTDLYLTYVKLILDYSVSVWAPHTNRAINQLDSIQWHGTHFVMSDYRRTSSVSSMLLSLHWYNTETQHKEAHLIMFYKIIHGIVNVPLPAYIHQSSRPSRGNHLKYIQPILNVDPYKFSFFPLQSNFGTTYHYILLIAVLWMILRT